MNREPTTALPPPGPAEASPLVAPPAVATAVERNLAALEPKLVALRRDIHAHPETGFDVARTAGLLAGELRELGLTVRTGVAGAGVVADLEGMRPGPRILVRAELDALPIREASGLEFAARGRAAHLCGHDLHLAAALGLADVLAGLRESLAARVRFCLQPAEELLAGALPMVAEGVLEGVDAVLGAHVLSALPLGTVVGIPALSSRGPTSSARPCQAGRATRGLRGSSPMRSSRRPTSRLRCRR
ncbi:M20/M25/M40 family metallo-hydrolase [Sinomonas gamaensis]|uniref:M20/M25/M40 family metallo-hydrolase n=1 Tax=Sinomonas gamaensis TaxID=2565624 RepID=UPI001107DBEF|nr:M20/M25/M40 family metallo-hydrolase [Sinomonas gamaensis]